jgi:long-chain fatty acid transport protein
VSIIRRLLTVCIILLLSITFVNCVFGSGFGNDAIGQKGNCMGNAMYGIADDASAVFYNPAGLAYNDRNIWYIEIYGYVALTGFEYSANSITDKSDEIYFVPGFFISKTFEKWSFGFGSYVPFAGGGTAYDDFQNSGFDLESYAGWNAFTGAVAYKVHHRLSIGIGMSMYVGKMENKAFNPLLGAVVKSEYDGISGYGGYIGLMYNLSENFKIGLIARSEVPIEMDGTVKTAGIKDDSEVEFTLPQYFTLGIGYKPAPKFMLGLYANYMLWGDLDKITFTTSNIENEVNTYYQNCWSMGAGVEYEINKVFLIRAGIALHQGATKVKGLNPSSNDIDILSPRIGVAYKITDSIEMNIQGLYSIGFEEEHDSKKYDQDSASITFGLRIKY